MEFMIPYDVQQKILKILKKGNNVELKKERGQLVVVEITRKVESKIPIQT